MVRLITAILVLIARCNLDDELLTCSYFWGSETQFCDIVHFSGVARRSSVVRAFAHCAMGRQIDPSWVEPIELFQQVLLPASAHVLSCLWDGAYRKRKKDICC